MKILAIKFETVNGKKTGRSFSFPMDPRKMAEYKTEATVRKKIEEYVLKNGPFKKEEMKDVKYQLADFLAEWKKQVAIREQEMLESLNDQEIPGINYDLERFVTAQAMAYDTAYEEMSEGCKRSHWIWYIFPQQKGLGHSYNSEYYGLDGEGEARAYLSHPILGKRLRDICEVLLRHEGKRDIDYIMGSGIDVLKLQTSMNLFNRVSPNDIFKKVLDAFF